MRPRAFTQALLLFGALVFLLAVVVLRLALAAQREPSRAAGVVKLAWDAAEGATAYHVYRRVNDGAPLRLTRDPVPQATPEDPWQDQAPQVGKNLYSVTAIAPGRDESQASNEAGMVFCTTIIP